MSPHSSRHTNQHDCLSLPRACGSVPCDGDVDNGGAAGASCATSSGGCADDEADDDEPAVYAVDAGEEADEDSVYA